MSLKNFDTNRGPLVRSIFVIFLYVLKSPLLVFLRLTFLNQQDSTPFNIFALELKFGISNPNLKIRFKVFFNIVLFVAHSISNRYSLSYSMIFRAPMSDIRRPSYYGSGAPDPGAFIQCVNIREPTIYELWCHGIDGLCR